MNVSVIIPVYNAVNFIEKAVNSALQHDEVKEIILVEDGGNDGALEKCKGLAANNFKIKLFQHEKGVNKGSGASRNLGIKKATQEYISFLDADDYFTTCRFDKEKQLFKTHQNNEGVYGAIGVEYLDKRGAAAWEAKGNSEESLTTVSKNIPHEHLFEFLIGVKNKGNYQGYFSLDGLTVKRDALIESKVLFDETLRLHQDTVFIWQLAYKLQLFSGELKKPIAIRGVHANNRFIHAKNLNESRSKCFLVLRNWAIDIKLNNVVIDKFHKIFFNNIMASKRKPFKILFYFYLLCTDRVTRANYSKKQLMNILKKTWL